MEEGRKPSRADFVAGCTPDERGVCSRCWPPFPPPRYPALVPHLAVCLQLAQACSTSWPHGLLTAQKRKSTRKISSAATRGKHSRRENAMPEIKLYEPPQLLVDWNKLGGEDRKCEMRHTRTS